MASVNFLLTNYPDINVAILGIFPRENRCKSQAATIINHVLQWKLPSLVTFIVPPKEFSTASGKPNTQFYERDMIHLNSKGYNVLLNALNSFITTDTDSLGLDATPTEQPPGDPNSNDSNDYAIGEFEFLGRGWDGEASLPQARVRTSTDRTSDSSLPSAPPTSPPVPTTSTSPQSALTSSPSFITVADKWILPCEKRSNLTSIDGEFFLSDSTNNSLESLMIFSSQSISKYNSFVMVSDSKIFVLILLISDI